MEKVWMYSTALCPYCVRARRLLEHKGVVFEEVRVDLEPQRRAEIYHRTGRRTVPQIFIGDRHIGDCEEIYALEAQGKLDALLTPAT